MTLFTTVYNSGEYLYEYLKNDIVLLSIGRSGVHFRHLYIGVEMDDSGLRYTELKWWKVNRRAVRDINALLPQLSDGVPKCTWWSLQRILKSGTRVFVAVDNGRIVGTVLLCRVVILVGRKDWIEDVIVDENYRRRGISSRLMDMAEQVSQDRGAKSINLTSKAHREEARRGYVNRGYVRRDSDLFRKVFKPNH